MRLGIRTALTRCLGLLFLFLVTVEQTAFSCPVCYGEKESAETEGARWAILFLLGVTGTVLTAIVAFVVRMRRRSRLHSVSGMPTSLEEL
jgi:heme/copper-type cytochrome/quinol oxidase subunit 2